MPRYFFFAQEASIKNTKLYIAEGVAACRIAAARLSIAQNWCAIQVVHPDLIRLVCAQRVRLFMCTTCNTQIIMGAFVVRPLS